MRNCDISRLGVNSVERSVQSMAHLRSSLRCIVLGHPLVKSRDEFHRGYAIGPLFLQRLPFSNRRQEADYFGLCCLTWCIAGCSVFGVVRSASQITLCCAVPELSPNQITLLGRLVLN